MYYFTGQYNLGDKNRNKLTFRCEKPADIALSSVYPQTSLSSGGVRIIFEGRISNIKEIAEYYNIQQIKSLSFSDIILELYQKNQDSFVSILQGVFAFVIYDQRKNKLLLYRDRFGIKPLYYYYENGIVVFGTTVKTLLKNKHVKKEVNGEWLYNFFELGSLNLGDETEFKNIRTTIPGKLLLFKKNGLSFKQIQYKDKYTNISLRDNEMSGKLYSLLENIFSNYFSTYKKASIAFSGGLDSNVILKFAIKNSVPIKTFTLEYETNSRIRNLDYEKAKKRAKKNHIEHFSVSCSPESVLELIKKDLSSLDRLTQLNYLNNKVIFDFVSEHQNLVFTGDGIEEQLGFYVWLMSVFYADSLVNNMEKDKNFNLIYKKLLKSVYSSFFGFENDGAVKKNSHVFASDFLNQLKDYNPLKYTYLCDLRVNKNNFSKKNEATFSGILNSVLNLTFHNVQIPTKINLNDYISKMNNIEICNPYLHESFIDFASNIPSRLKVRIPDYKNSKYIFREAVDRLVGKKDAFSEFKSGSNIPYHEWFLEESFEKFVKSVLNKKRISKSGIFDVEKIEILVNSHYDNRQFYDWPNAPGLFKKGIDNTNIFMKLIPVQLWWEEHFG